MNREMLSYFSLSNLPFTKELTVEALHRLPSVELAIKKLHMLSEVRGIGLLTGKSGTGKSTLLRLFISELNKGLYKPFYICHSSVGIVEFYSHLATSFGLQATNRRSTMFRSIKERILSLNQSSRIHPILLLDEAHLLNNDILKELRLLTNFEIDSYNALTILLCGQESLHQKFGLSMLEPLANSIGISVMVGNLAKEETFSYVEGRIIAVGGTTNLFTKGALNLIHQASGGVMRMINTIAGGALLKAYLLKQTQVETEHVQAVIER